MTDLAQREATREEFQTRLDKRLEQAAEVQITARLGLLVGHVRYLVALEDAGEILPLTGNITPVPNTRSWLLGLTNLRGVLHAVTDFSAFVGLGPTPINKDCRLLAVSNRFGINSALLVTRMLGLHNPVQWNPVNIDEATEQGLPVGPVPWSGACDDVFLKVQR
jgi:twitching motility protein PilI